MAGRLQGKVCVITGTASGIGAASARLFAAEGARVVGIDLVAEGAEGELTEVRPEAGILAFRLRDRDAALGFEAAGKILVARRADEGA